MNSFLLLQITPHMLRSMHHALVVSCKFQWVMPSSTRVATTPEVSLAWPNPNHTSIRHESVSLIIKNWVSSNDHWQDVNLIRSFHRIAYKDERPVPRSSRKIFASVRTHDEMNSLNRLPGACKVPRAAPRNSAISLYLAIVRWKGLWIPTQLLQGV